MSNTEHTSNNTNSMWHFIENHLPNYYSRDDVLVDDILYRFITGDDVCDEDMHWIQTEFNGDKSIVRKELIRMELGFVEESLLAYYERFFAI